MGDAQGISALTAKVNKTYAQFSLEAPGADRAKLFFTMRAQWHFIGIFDYVDLRVHDIAPLLGGS